MKYLKLYSIEDYTKTHHIVYFPYGDGEVILLLPFDKNSKILVGVNRIPFLEFMSIQYSNRSYDFFEYDMDINYRFINNTVIIDNIGRVQNSLIEFSKMVYDILKLGGTESKYLSQSMQQSIDFAISNRACIEDTPQKPFENKCITLSVAYGISDNYEILIGNKTIFRSKNRLAINTMWNVLEDILRIFKMNISRRL